MRNVITYDLPDMVANGTSGGRMYDIYRAPGQGVGYHVFIAAPGRHADWQEFEEFGELASALGYVHSRCQGAAS